MATLHTIDAYAVLEINPNAHQAVVRAAYHALARQFHPDGPTPDPDRMADLNLAYDLIRDEERRRAYDERSQALGLNGDAASSAVGPGVEEFQASPDESSDEFVGPFTRRAQAHPERDPSGRLDFGRYAGWSIRDLARQDPDYLRWLGRHSSGVRFRDEILRRLPNE